MEINANSEKCFKLAESWLENCVKKHTLACARTTGIFQPTRLVDVGPSDGSKAPHLWIASEGGYQPMQPRNPYVALSYCWGNVPFLTLTSSTIEALKSSIPMYSLPQTVRDAIMIVRRLGIRYLWVDSLCIIQGSDKEAHEDWIRISENMNLIYREAFLTIVAAGANNAHAGIFKQRNRAMQHCLLDYPSSSCFSGTVAIGPVYEKNPRSSEPLDCRAWALQERLLSTRILEYGTAEMSWKCRCAVRSESGTRSDTSTVVDLTKSLGPPTTSEELALSHAEAHDIWFQWTSIVEDYSGRDMTRLSDKLTALSGLVKVVQNFYNDKYLAGIWQSQLPEQLLWKHLGKTVNGRKTYPRPSSYRAPSWAWTSVDGKVEFCAPVPKKLAAKVVRIISCRVETSLPTHFGPVISGGITCYGLVKKMPTIRYESVGRYYGCYERYTPWMYFADGMRTFLDNVDELPKKTQNPIPEDDPKELFNTWFLFIQPDLSTGLILQKQGFSIIPVFKRIGLFEGYHARKQGSAKCTIRHKVLRII